jgi:hypothetical protein
MLITTWTSPQFAGLAAMLGALLYAIGDVLLLAGRAELSRHPNLQPHAKLLSGTERLAELSWPRLMWGGLLGVFATPLLLGSLWLLYSGLAPAGPWAAWPPVLLFGLGFILAPFVHGSFIYLGEYVQALDRVGTEAQAVIVGMYRRLRQVMLITYGALAAALVAASLWFSAAVFLGGTRFPPWMALVNPITTLLAWLVLRRLIPSLARHLEGAGFNIAFLAFFVAATITLR